MENLKSVYVLGPYVYGIDDMFKRRGWHVYYDYNIEKANKDPDLICFAGGTDINPAIYGEKPAGCDQWDEARDAFDISQFKKYAGKVPIVGICRGGQLVNCLNGGRLWQHVDNHTSSHYIQTHTGEQIFVSSTHHQMMIPADDEGVVLAWTQRATIKQREKYMWSTSNPKTSDNVDPEVIYYSKHKHLCFQPHPEFGPDSCEKYFFKLVHKYLTP